MRKLMLIYAVLSALAAVLTGCTSSTRIEWGGKTAVRQPDGTVVVAQDGSPYYESEKNVYKDSNWLTKREERDLKVAVNPDGSYEASLGARVNDVSSNGVAMVTGAIDATTKLVAEAAAAYVKVAGGGAQADVVSQIVSKAVASFAAGGGDAGKAKASEAGGKLVITDGDVCTTCTTDGTCTTGACTP